MHSVNIFLLSLLLISKITARNVNEENPRLFGYSYTTTVIKPHVITSFIPSSCVQVDATLPPCRTMRSFRTFPKLEARSLTNTSSLNITTQEETVHTTPLSWGEYLGIYAPTVTITSTQIIVTTVVDPGVQVTYAIKGCRPKLLPSGLERCVLSDSEITELNQVNVEPSKVEIQPTSTLLSQEIQDKVDNNINTTANIVEESTILESSTFINEEEEFISVATPIDGLEDIGTTMTP